LSSSDATLHLTISGRVQGVGYRAWARREAEKHGLSGWVRNRSDGTVEALVSGPEDAVRRFLFACHTGPLAASVKQVDVTPSTEPVESGFRQLPTF